MGFPLRLLIVEDSQDDTFFLLRTLERAGYTITYERVDAEAAMRVALVEQQWDLITSDHAMPRFNAPQALRLAKELSPNTPLLIVSGEIDLNLAVSLMKAGADDYVQKSELARLPAAVERALRDVAARQERRQMVSAMRESEARFRILVNSMGDIVFTLDRERRFTGVFGDWVEKFGYTPDYFLGKTSHQLAGLSGGTIPEDVFWRALDGEVVTYELALPGPGGVENYFHISLSPIRQAETITGVVGVGREITALRKAERALQADYALRDAIISNAMQGLCLFHPIPEAPFLRFTIWNERLVELTGYTLEEINTLDWLETIFRSAPTRETIGARLEHVIQGGEWRSEEVEIACADGSLKTISVSTTWLEMDGGIRHALALVSDETERKRTRAALEERIRFETLLSDLSASFFQNEDETVKTQIEGDLQRVAEFLDMDRCSLAELSEDGSVLKTSFSYAVPFMPAAMPAFSAAVFPWLVATLLAGHNIFVKNALDAPPGAEIEKEFCRRSGIQSIVSVPLKSGETVVGALTLISFRPAELMLAEYFPRLRLIGEFFLTVARRSRAEADRDRLFELLRLSRLGQSDLYREPVDLAQMGRDIFAELRQNEPDRQVEFVVPDELLAYADPSLLRVALENLLGNAWKFTGKRAQARIEMDRLPGSQPVFFVRDNGAGFEMAQANRLFGIFQRLHSLEEFPGIGVGLATVQGVIQRHGGRVWAESVAGQGSTFYFTLPYVKNIGRLEKRQSQF